MSPMNSGMWYNCICGNIEEDKMSTERGFALSFENQYPDYEHQLFEENQNLQAELKRSIQTVATNEEKKMIDDDFVTDGFYPYYTDQKVKILFIGKESLGLEGLDYIEILMNSIKHNDPKGHGLCSNNKDPFHSKSLYIAYGVNHSCYDWNTIPWASDLGMKHFAVKGGISYAMVNFSKLSNPAENHWALDKNRFQTYCNLIKRTGINWYEEQIRLLNPDLIVSMNIECLISTFFGDQVIWKYNKHEDKEKKVSFGFLTVKGRNIPIVDTWHFSAPGKAFMNCYLNPIAEIWENEIHSI